jgi:hypothetical protein
VISVTVEKKVGKEWKITPNPNDNHSINMLDDALRESKAFRSVVPNGDHIVGVSKTPKLSKKSKKLLKKAAKIASFGEKVDLIMA